MLSINKPCLSMVHECVCKQMYINPINTYTNKCIAYDNRHQCICHIFGKLCLRCKNVSMVDVTQYYLPTMSLSLLYLTSSVS